VLSPGNRSGALSRGHKNLKAPNKRGKYPLGAALMSPTRSRERGWKAPKKNGGRRPKKPWKRDIPEEGS